MPMRMEMIHMGCGSVPVDEEAGRGAHHVAAHDLQRGDQTDLPGRQSDLVFRYSTKKGELMLMAKQMRKYTRRTESLNLVPVFPGERGASSSPVSSAAPYPPR